MANIAVFISSIAYTGEEGPTNGKFNVSWTGVVDTNSDPRPGALNGDVLVDFSAQDHSINQAVLDDAVAVAQVAGFTVGASDRKVLFCGANRV